MQTVTTITPKFQVHIPAVIRKQAGITRHGRALIRTEKQRIIIEPVTDDFLTLGGSFSVAKPTPAEKIRQYIDYTDNKK